MKIKDTQTSEEMRNKLSNLEGLMPGMGVWKVVREFARYLSKRRVPLEGLTPEEFQLNYLLGIVELQKNDDGFGSKVDSPLVVLPSIALDMLSDKASILAKALYSVEFAARVEELNQSPVVAN
jgi:hypothetical protein